MVYLKGLSTDAYFNLALEQYIFDELPRTDSYLYLWQNANAVIIGKYQNANAEINAPFVRERGIQVVRRLSGGGAVYHDLGNLNFTIIADAAEDGKIDFAYFISPLARALQGLGVQAEISGRNDITVEGAKFSGNAQYVKQGRVMHHGTIMYNSDLSVLSKALKPRGDKFEDKAVKSVRARVTNLKPYMGNATLEDLKAAFIEELSKITGSNFKKYDFTARDLEAVKKLAEERYSRWDWNYGRSPKFQRENVRRSPGVGTVVARFSCEKGRITAYQSRGDYFGEGDGEDLLARLIGTPLEESALRAALEGLDLGRFYRGMTRDVFVRLLVD
jgi:lipoate-protein ligase A